MDAPVPVDWDAPAPPGSANYYVAREYGRQIAEQAMKRYAENQARIKLAEDSMFKGMQLRNTNIRNASDVNKELNLKNAPYKQGTFVFETELKQKTTFVRVYDDVNSNMKGSWLMRGSDIRGLTPQQIKDLYSLPTLPKYYVEVTFDAGTKLRAGVAGPIEGWGRGGGLQYDTKLNSGYVGTYGQEKLLP